MADDARGEALILGVAGVVAAIAARKVVDVVWVSAAGRHTPKPDDPRENLNSAMLAAAVTGAAVGLLRVLITRKAKEISRKRASA